MKPARSSSAEDTFRAPLCAPITHALVARGRSRFEEQIPIDNPDLAQRQRLFRIMLSKQPVDFDRDAVAAEMAGLTPGIGGRDIRSVIERASRLAIRRAAGNPKAVMLTRADLVGSVPKARPGG
jgi:SpoVK/Ycf46/Vps4 family AAA+-type ATPase